ncbi:hypothetical protein CLV51_103762 [Chitinophaga niastensis]|uniref:Copper-binding protein MbnP-like domain-containing protein n=1 Tax=Chitinophaga niastensis TaxID=536980 RepID=A0A2P8HKT4_CHINA|nr:MbnP family protein [Chitinophaga niastensis]PSL46780.1 hypothetical protein CLV51_103762 [Chitinophaga niastensis]
MILRIFVFYPCWFLMLNCWCASLTNSYRSEPITQIPAEISSLQLSITHMMHNQPLILKTVEYRNPSGESFTITRFRYFLSNFSLETAAGKMITLPAAYFLVDEANDTTKLIKLNSVPTGTYKSIRFLIGVDSIRNVSGAQSGALAAETGMFWTWNSGYIMAKMEGFAPAVASPTHEFLFHVGGYKTSDNVLKYVSLSFPQPVVVSRDKQPQINILADAGKWFAPDTISFKNVAVIMAPGVNARKVAANYQEMFTVKNIAN